MYQGKQIFRFKIEHFLIFALLVLLLASCKNERPQTIVTTPTLAPTVESISAIDPTIAAVLAQVSPTPELTATTQPNNAPTQTPKFVCEPPANWVTYTVQPNDTLIAIANALGISVGDIKNANCKLDDALSVGEILYLPTQPPILQSQPINQLPPVNTNQNLTTNTAENLPQGSIQELGYAGGGGGTPNLRVICIEDGEPGQIFVSDQGEYLLRERVFQVVICQPITKDISITLTYPDGETIPLEFSNESFFVDDENSFDLISSDYQLPLGHPNGEYLVTIMNYPEKGKFEIRRVNLQEGLPTIRVNELDETIQLYYFEPNEKIHLLTYQHKDTASSPGNTSVELVTSIPYQVNSDGYLIIESVPELWSSFDSTQTMLAAAIGEISGFTSDIIGGLKLVNKSSESICQLLLTPINTTIGVDLFYYGGNFDSNTNTETQYPEQYKLTNLGFYDIEAKNCDDEIVYKSENVNLTHETIWEIP